MTRAELILEWARLLLQGQVLAAVLVAVAMFVWREPIRQLIRAMAERGFSFTSGSFSGELAAGAGEGATPVPELPPTSGQAGEESVQSERLKGLALDFTDIVREGPEARSAFARRVRREHGEGWSWSFLEGVLGHPRMTVRFCAASLLVAVAHELDPAQVAAALSRESSSLVRFRLVEALEYWASSPGASGGARERVLEVLRHHSEENAFVGSRLGKLKSFLSR